MITMSRLGRDGQLGNQLFQYAMLRSVAVKNGYKLSIPKRFDGVKMQNLVELSKFFIEADELAPTEVFSNKYIDGDGEYNPAVFEQPDGTDYQGWYQSEKYFVDIAPQIRREFRFYPDIDNVCNTFVNEIRQDAATPVISLHVRRGDYVTHHNKFRVLGLSYYVDALDTICKKLSLDEKPKVIVFSDDIPWCRSNLKLEKAGVTVFAEQVSHWHDLCAMTKCDHHIISASSFSWWGAWLNASTSKVVVAPRPWFNSGLLVSSGKPFNTKDMVPESWTVIETMENYE